MPDPRVVFEHPEQHWDFLTASDDTEFEGQFFDRKEAGRVGENGLVSSKKLDGVLEQITGCISAFANTNKSGSLLVVGISTQGAIKGVNHLSDNQRSRLTGFNDFLSDQAAQAKFFECTNEFGKQDFICLIYVPYTSRRICQTLGNYPRVWTRQGSQNICLNQSQLEQLRRDKGVVDYEQADCCVYDVRDLDLQVLQEFRKVFLLDSGYEYSDEELLYQVGAINRNSDGYNFTNAGMLFFAANPQRVLSASFIRLLRFETDVENIEDRGLPTFDRKFTGSITKQVRDIRAFFRESGFFKLYQTRNPDGGFLEVPEYPLIAVDEAIVNAVAHREYAIGLPIECESYRNAFVVRNSGRLQQRDKDVPAEFSLEDMRLNSAPRNPKLIEWLKMMRDERGAEFVRALSEGTRRMRDEMKRSGLSAPIYKMNESQTTVILFNNVQERETSLSSSIISEDVDGQEISLTIVNDKSLKIKTADMVFSLFHLLKITSILYTNFFADLVRKRLLRNQQKKEMETLKGIMESMGEVVVSASKEKSIYSLSESYMADIFKKSPQACIQIGSLLMVKNTSDDGKSTLSVRTLTDLELKLLDKNQSMLQHPDKILEWLKYETNSL
jgi:predicted HTH transcriptional regulator